MTKSLSPEALEMVSNFEKNERVLVGRLMIKLLKIVSKEKYLVARNLYAYIRYLDDLVDEGKDVTSVMEILKKEIEFLKSLKAVENENIKSKNSPREWVLQALRENINKDAIVEQLINGIKAFYLDSISIKYKRPLSEKIQSQRDLYTLLSYLEVLSIILFNTQFSGRVSPEDFSEIISAWAKYDALRDFEEDFMAGLIIFSRRELKEFDLNLKSGEKVPNEFNKLHEKLKPRVITKILKNLHLIYKADIPIAAKLAFQSYFFITIIKLLGTRPMGDKEIIFAQAEQNEHPHSSLE